MYLDHFVRFGDTLDKLANFYNVSIEEIKRVNNLVSDDIKLGQVLKIPFETALVNYIVQEGDTLYSIAKRYNIREEDLAFLNGVDMGEYLHPGEAIWVPREGYLVYVTGEGDSITQVERDLGVSRIDLIKFNKNFYLLPEQLIVYDENVVSKDSV